MWHVLKSNWKKPCQKHILKGYWKHIASQFNEKYQLNGKNCINLQTLQNLVYSSKFQPPKPIYYPGNTSPLLQIEEWAVQLLLKCGEMN